MQPTFSAVAEPLASPDVRVATTPGAQISARMDRLPITRHL